MDNAGQTTLAGTNVDPLSGLTTTTTAPVAAQQNSGARRLADIKADAGARRLLRGSA